MSLKKITLKKGEAAFLQGTFDGTMYRLVEGGMGIFNAKEIDESNKIADIEKGAFFGERALINKLPRAVSAIALEDNTVLEVITKEDFETVLANPQDAKAIVERLSMALHELSLDYIEACRKIVELDDAGAVKNPDSGMAKFIAKCREITDAVGKMQTDRANIGRMI